MSDVCRCVVDVCVCGCVVCVCVCVWIYRLLSNLHRVSS